MQAGTFRRGLVPARLLYPANGAAYVPVVEILEIQRRGGRRLSCAYLRAGAGAAPNLVSCGGARAVRR
ncbi:hypothetical protein XFF6166_360048 [Xanthomonas citri pv. fuscans]|nr:hypothetical protein XFF6166_360048 [Xanthomonas citri pv. fuscans]SOO00922.1 hypothetical protein XFF6960_40048 [Xanthomonas citri pv. fuscans]SOO05386.1 hypothetical protein XFF7767_390048 [Xanthomonas citri pv. fuscans]SOO10235.1 hypothetical protein XFF6970_510045 [Xanthomonas citri pv. fuscans]SOO16893.1 hypothetical protein XFF7766_950006 [Xanthomonas citri pv. fuscans]